MRLEGDDFKKNLPGLWEGYWSERSVSGKIRIKIIEIDGNNVHLTGFAEGTDLYPDAYEVSGRLENSTLLITWPTAAKKGVDERYTMNRDDSGNLILNGNWRAKIDSSSGTCRLKKIE
jgi:hypothetical protein